MPLSQVRSKLGIIAQDPILLSGTLRLNLDIEGEYSDEQLYDALHQVQLLNRKTSSTDMDEQMDGGAGGGDGVSSSASTLSNGITSTTLVVEAGVMDGGQANIFANLDSEIKTGGENLSTGEKQLVVLARALLKHHKILILDEATASIDSATDAEISRVIHKEFTNSTVIIIAHRLRTIMPCSKILVMDKGNLIQQGTPLELIKQDGGKFQALCQAAGDEEYQHLISLAEQSYLSQKM
ncbi:P-loop containing nucleoside triphosphate hydrolase protein [Papiliotrema laurentii]|uniref:P-loop containing nucleoside triphosphate hydrolase protein n=1 Tax=Papiliotrema laurentii TaxID=5418 RepID=A0AAD9FVJ3_PAPLA|nr:P-loop containing nucleoside triphosphate hydrolase protein [Papiliotrema laurentii]